MPAREPEGFPEVERFQVRRHLGGGSSGVVYEAFDQKRGALVAVKVLREQSLSHLYEFKREFRSLSALSHPNLVALYEMFSVDHRWFFTMELVDGVTLLEFVTHDGAVEGAQSGESDDTLRDISKDEGARSGQPAPHRPPPLSLPRLLASMNQLTAGLVALHRAGKVHRDIKPANVLCTPDGRVVILDFGITQELHPERSAPPAEFSGTPAYMAPEQTTGQAVTAAADWYSVGVLLYEALAGTLPFVGTAPQLVRQKLSQEPPPPSRFRPEIPPLLGELSMRLLERDPARRAASEQIFAALLEIEQGGDGPPSQSRQGPPQMVPFVGRGHHLAALREAFEESRAGRAVVVLCQGESGSGKSTLCERFLDDLLAREERAVALVGRCFEHEDVPFKALDGVIDSLGSVLRHLDTELAELLPQDAGLLAKIFPVLQLPAIQALPQRALADPRRTRLAAFGALRELLTRIASRRPLTLFIDDLQWGDLDSVSVLLDLVRPPAPPALLLVLSYRSDEEDSSAPLLALRQGLRDGVLVRELRVGELDSDEAVGLARALLPQGARSRAALIAAEAQGNPFFITELSRSAPRPDETPATLHGLLDERKRRLGAQAWRLLEVACVAGQPLPRVVAAAVLRDESGQDELHSLSALRSERLLRVRYAREEAHLPGPREELLPYHDRVRETVLLEMTPGRQEELHLRLAHALQKCGLHEPERLVFHLQRGGDHKGAAHQAAEAVEHALRAFAYHQAVRLCKAALEAHALPAQQTLEVQMRLATALEGAGRPREAATAYERLANLDAPRTMTWLRSAARQYMAGGYLDDGRRTIDLLARAANLRIPRSSPGLTLGIFACRLLLAARGTSFRERPESDLPTEELRRFEVLEVFLSAMSIHPVLAVYGIFWGFWSALKLGEPRRISRLMSMFALADYAMAGSHQRTLTLLARAHELAKRSRDDLAMAYHTYGHGHLAHLQGRWRASSELILQSRECLKTESSEATYVIHFAEVVHIYNLRWMGDLQGLAEEISPLLKDAIEAGNLSQEISMRCNAHFLLHLAANEPSKVERIAQQSLARIDHQSSQMLHLFIAEAQLLTLLYQGQPSRAWEHFSLVRASILRSGLTQFSFFKVIWKNLEALIAIASGRPAASIAPLIRDLHRAEPGFASPMASLLQALLLRRQGNLHAALEHAWTAQHGFERCDMALHAASVKLRRGAWLGDPQGAAIKLEAEAWMRSQGVVQPARMASLVAPEQDP